MHVNIGDELDCVTAALDKLYTYVKEGMKVPNPHVLTLALFGLYPGCELIPSGTTLALCAGGTTWRVQDVPLDPRQSYDEVLWLRRILTGCMSEFMQLLPIVNPIPLGGSMENLLFSPETQVRLAELNATMNQIQALHTTGIPSPAPRPTNDEGESTTLYSPNLFVVIPK